MTGGQCCRRLWSFVDRSVTEEEEEGKVRTSLIVYNRWHHIKAVGVFNQTSSHTKCIITSSYHAQGSCRSGRYLHRRARALTPTTGLTVINRPNRLPSRYQSQYTRLPAPGSQNILEQLEGAVLTLKEIENAYTDVRLDVI